MYSYIGYIPDYILKNYHRTCRISISPECFQIVVFVSMTNL